MFKVGDKVQFNNTEKAEHDWNMWFCSYFERYDVVTISGLPGDFVTFKESGKLVTCPQCIKQAKGQMFLPLKFKRR